MKCDRCGQEINSPSCPRCDGPAEARQEIEVSYHDYKTSEMLEIRPKPAVPEQGPGSVGSRNPSVAAPQPPLPVPSRHGRFTVVLLLLLMLLLGGFAYFLLRSLAP